MATKVCRKCGVERDLETGFHVKSRSPDGRRGECKQCRRPHKAVVRDENLAAGLLECSSCRSVKPAGEFHRKSRSVTGHHDACKVCRKQKSKAYYWSDPEGMKAKVREYQQAHREERRAYHREWRTSTPARIAATRCRGRLGSFLRGWGRRKKTKTQQLVGCSWQELADHLERHFEPGMSWDNTSEWHIDHHIPLAVCYDAPAGEHWVEALSHWSNLRPMWGADNISKNCRLPDEVFVP